MTTAFQVNAFQNNAFQIGGASLIGTISYLLMFNSAGDAQRDPIVEQYWNLNSQNNIGVNPNIWVYDLVSGSSDTRYGLFITLPVPLISQLYNHSNIELVANSPNSLNSKSVVLKNLLSDQANNYSFLVNALSAFPLQF